MENIDQPYAIFMIFLAITVIYSIAKAFPELVEWVKSINDIEL